MGIKVKATQLGFYGNQLREPGTVFEIANKKELGSWMLELDKEVKGKAGKAGTAGNTASDNDDADADSDADKTDTSTPLA